MPQTNKEERINITIPYAPFSQKRHRNSRWGGVYDPSAPDKELVLAYLQTIKNTLYIIEPPIGMEIWAYMPIPKSLSKKKQLELEGTLQFKKPDYDNIGKFYGDVLEGLCYSNDSHISFSTVHKIYSSNPRVEIRLWHCD